MCIYIVFLLIFSFLYMSIVHLKIVILDCPQFSLYLSHGPDPFSMLFFSCFYFSVIYTSLPFLLDCFIDFLFF